MHAVADGQCVCVCACALRTILTLSQAAQVNAQRWIQYTLFHLKFIASLFL